MALALCRRVANGGGGRPLRPHATWARGISAMTGPVACPSGGGAGLSGSAPAGPLPDRPRGRHGRGRLRQFAWASVPVWSASKAGRNLAPVSVGARELADVLLPPFEMAVRESGVRSVMHAYTEIDGI